MSPPHTGSGWRPRWPGGWVATVVLVAAVLALPVMTVLSFLFTPNGEVWHHLVDTVLARYVTNSLLLMAGVAVGVLLIGIGCAWVTAMCSFPGRRLFEWALLLPMAMPAYIIAYTYTGLLDYTGPLQSGLRELFGWGYGDYWFPEVRSLGGAITMLSLVLYPYVYLLARAAFLTQSTCVLEVSRTLGNGPWRTLFGVALPLARPALIAGLSLALMETLADYGTVHYFGVDTFTTGIFRTWYGLDNAAAAAQLASLLLLFVFALILAERWSRQRARYHHTGQRHPPPQRIELPGWRGVAALLLCITVLAAGFLVPAGQLLIWALTTWQRSLNSDFLILIGNSLLLAALAAMLALLLALLLGYGQRLNERRPVVRLAVRMAGLGYAVPGTVIAVGVIIPFAAFDNALDGWLRDQFGFSSGLLLSGSLVALLFAYLVRFLSVSLQTVEAGLGRIRSTYDEAARSLGYRSGEVLRHVHLPMLRSALLTAILLVFVDVLKELPATLILRPFNFNTLAVRAFELASDERLADAAAPALAIVLVGIVPVILLSRSIGRGSEEMTT